jgi:hypothetical protein
MKHLLVCGTLSVVACIANSESRSEEIGCPGRLDNTIQTSSAVPAGWLVRQSPLKHTLSGVRINLGDPGAGTDGAIYDRRRVQKGPSGEEVETLSWDLSSLREPYLVCSYFGTTIALVRSVAGMSRCEVITGHSKGSFRIEVRSATCS